MKFEYWFANVKGISNRRKIEIGERFPELEELYYLDEFRMIMSGITDKEREALFQSIKVWNVELEYQKMLDKEIQCCTFFHKDYPEKLKEIHSGRICYTLRERCQIKIKKQ